MPELPEVETIANGFRQTITSIMILNTEIDEPRVLPFDADKFSEILLNDSISDVRRINKYLVFDLSNNYSLLFHLRITGQLVLEQQGDSSLKFPCLKISLENGQKIALYDRMRSAIVNLLPTDQILNLEGIKKLGPEFLTDACTESYFINALSNRKRAIHTLLLDQTIAAGLGNIYVNEALFLSGIHPAILAVRLKENDLSLLYKNINDLLIKAIEHGGTTFSSFKNAFGKPGTFQKHLTVFRRKGKPCLECGTSIERATINGRGGFYCPHCQT